jgi:hypothetical protein
VRRSSLLPSLTLRLTLTLLLSSEELETTAAAPPSDSESTDSGEEFNEELDIVRVPVSLKSVRQKKQTQRKRTSRGKESESEEAETEDSDSGSPQKRRRIRRKKAPVWSETEDTRLRELYVQYAGSRSIFDTIATSASHFV